MEFLYISSYCFVLCFSEFLSITYEQMVIGEEDGFDVSLSKLLFCLKLRQKVCSCSTNQSDCLLVSDMS